MSHRTAFHAHLADGVPWGRVFLTLAVVGLVTACGEEAPPAADPVRPIKTLTIIGASGEATREYPGTVKAAQTAEMAFEVPGKIVEFVYKEGARVDEGALLARLDARDYQAQYDAVLADYENTRVNFERAQKLYENDALAALERDRRRTRMQENEAKLRTASKALEDTELRAPFAGVMARKLVDDFENVIAKQSVLILTDDSHLELKLDVPERDLSGEVADHEVGPAELTRRVRPEVVVSSLPDRRFPAQFTEIARTADVETRTFEVTAVFQKGPGVQILPGMTAKLIVHLSDKQRAAGGLRIPVQASVTDETGQAFVWVLEPDSNTVSKRPVTLGEFSGSDVRVRGGLEAGEVIAISGMGQLREGLTVRPLSEQD